MPIKKSVTRVTVFNNLFHYDFFHSSIGGTIPQELLPAAVPGTDDASLNPDLVVIDRDSNQLHIFVLSIADESDIPEIRKSVLEKYYNLVNLNLP